MTHPHPLTSLFPSAFNKHYPKTPAPLETASSRATQTARSWQPLQQDPGNVNTKITATLTAGSQLPQQQDPSNDDTYIPGMSTRSYWQCRYPDPGYVYPAPLPQRTCGDLELVIASLVVLVNGLINICVNVLVNVRALEYLGHTSHLYAVHITLCILRHAYCATHSILGISLITEAAKVETGTSKVPRHPETANIDNIHKWLCRELEDANCQRQIEKGKENAASHAQGSNTNRCSAEFEGGKEYEELRGKIDTLLKRLAQVQTLCKRVSEDSITALANATAAKDAAVDAKDIEASAKDAPVRPVKDRMQLGGIRVGLVSWEKLRSRAALSWMHLCTCHLVLDDTITSMVGSLLGELNIYLPILVPSILPELASHNFYHKQAPDAQVVVDRMRKTVGKIHFLQVS
ncbi:hypothetical protein BDK51DRAFT_31187 [Blyttiomyces helicus]|uniref:Uncharacterized protein n=1 Tax=Blyttiomyces helicus TaxID=388810 RepID=A0A4P9WR18_9FUNG|nr:hypothetical protein BDK51DRAFT_31187 [Blyttiomyces helicus]|eukprot:RKO93326.1 hypothetical protein BDK51DRAFT_31187 [Blyttiomyces helicus]